MYVYMYICEAVQRQIRGCFTPIVHTFDCGNVMRTDWTVREIFFGFVLDRFRLEKVVRPSDRTPILAGGGGHPGDTRGAGRRREAPKGAYIRGADAESNARSALRSTSLL